jgi:hypothetical protein
LLDNSIPVPFSGCRLWLGEMSTRGYGLWRRYQAHRASYRAFRGEIPSGLLVCHHCDVKLCVEPTHLYAGTRGDNTRDAWMRSPKMQQILREGLLSKRPRVNGRWVAAGGLAVGMLTPPVRR